MRFLFTLIAISLATIISYGQQTTFSKPVDLPLTGWNKVIQTSNGYTTLIHIENNKSITTIVYDTLKELVSTRSYISKTIDHNLLNTSRLHGIYEINGQVVVFLQQEIFGKETLFRLCFNTQTGVLVEEAVVLKSKTLRKAIEFHVSCNESTESYAVFGMKDLLADYKEELYLHIYDKNHKELNKAKIPIETNGIDYVRHISTKMHHDGGVVVSLLFRNVIKHSTVMDNKMVISYLAPGDTSFSNTVTPLANNAAPYYALSSADNFTHNINYLYVDAIRELHKNGLQRLGRTIYVPTLIQYSTYNLNNINHNRLTVDSAEQYLLKHIDGDYYRLKKAPLAPLYFYTNKYGLSTLVSEIIHQRFFLKESKRTYTCLGDIVVTQINTDREIVWTAVIPKRQLTYGNLNGLKVRNRNIRKNLFRGNNEIDWEYQFASINTYYTSRRNTFLIYNDMPNNIGKPISLDIDTVYDFAKSDAVFCKIGRDKKIKQGLLYEGARDTAENYSSLIETADFDKHTATYSTLVLHREGDKKELLLGWTKLDDE